jgi:hypothetical protein
LNQRWTSLILPVALIVGLTSIAAVALWSDQASAQGGEEDLSLANVTFTKFDSDGDGLLDSVRINATAVNSNTVRSRFFVLKGLIMEGDAEIDVETRSGLLGADQSIQLELQLEVAMDAEPGTFKILVELYSETLTGPLADDVETSMLLFPLGRYELVLAANRTSAVALENTSVSFTVTVTSSSNNPTGVELSLSGIIGWTIVIAPTNLTLEPSQSGEATVSVLVPHNEPPGSMEHITVTGVAARNTTASDATTMSVMVKMQVFDIEMEIANPFGSVASGKTLELSGFVYNIGNNQDNITFWADVPQGWTTEFSPPNLVLARDRTAGFLFRLTAPTTLPGSGTLAVNVTARSMGLIETASVVVMVAFNTAELSIDGANVSFNPNPHAGQPLSVIAPVINNGAVMADIVEVALLVDGDEVARTTVKFINVGESGLATLIWTSIPGWHRLTISADPDNLIGEAHEDDNTFERSVNVLSPDLDISPNDITLEPSYPPEGSETTVSITVRNLRPVDTVSFNVTLYIDDVAVTTFFVEGGLLGDGEVTIAYEWTAVAGRHAFKADVDTNGMVMEDDESNNLATRSFTVNGRPAAVLDVHQEVADLGATITIDGSASSDADGRITHYFFDYGDGTNSGWTFESTVDHVYTDGGEYDIRLYVRDEGGAESSEPAITNITINEPKVKKDDTPGLSAAVALAAIAASIVSMMVLRIPWSGRPGAQS